MLGTLVGIVSGLGAILFQSLLHLISDLFMYHFAGLRIAEPAGEMHDPIFSHGPVLSIETTQTIDTAQELMIENAVEELLVIDHVQEPTKVLGILTSGDILMAYNRKLADMRNSEFTDPIDS